MAHANPPQLRSNPKEQDWKYFNRLLDNYFLIVKAGDDAKLPILLNSLGQDGLDIYDGLPNPKATYVDCVARLTGYFQGKTSVLLRRKAFFQSQQETMEIITKYACKLRRLARECEFGETLNQMLRDIFVIGVRDDRLGERLLSEDATVLTFDEAIKRAEAFERARTERRTVHQDTLINQTIAHLPSKETSRSRGDGTSNYCYRCGSKDHRANFSKCPAIKATCRKCSKVGHFKVVCRATKNFPQATLASTSNVLVSSHDQQEFSVFATGSIETMRRDVLINGQMLTVLADTGSQCNILPHHCVTCDLTLQPTTTKVTAFGNFPIRVIGETTCVVCYAGASVSDIFLVVDVPDSLPLFSADLCRKLGILKEIASVECVPAQGQSDVENLLSKFDSAGLFTGLGCVKNFEYKIELDESVTPVSEPPRRLPPAIASLVDNKLQSMVHEGVIRKVEEPTDWCSPLVITKRKTGDIRICTDFRKLNTAIKRSVFQIPDFDDIIARVNQCELFSLLDCKSAFHQLSVSSNCQTLLTFASHSGRYCWQRVPYGLKSAPELFQSFLSNLLRNVPRVFVFFDDILIATKSIDDHISTLSRVMEILLTNGVTLNKEKCQFCKPSIDFLGHTLSSAGVTPSVSKVQSIKDMVLPDSKEKLRSFLGLAAYIGHKFVPHFSSLTAPLWSLCAVNSDFQWTAETQNAFEKLQSAIANVSELAWFNPHKPVAIHSDASGDGLGAVLLQEGKPIAYASRRLTEIEKRYSTIEKEFLGIVFALYKFRRLIAFATCHVYTDHKPILGLIDKNIDKLPLRIQKWIMHIQSFDITLQYLPGSKNCLADALSRNPVPAALSHSALPYTESVEHSICFILQKLPLNLESVATATAHDNTLQAVIRAIHNNWKDLESRKIAPYYSFRDELSLKLCSDSPDSTVVMKGHRVILPSCVVNAFLEQVHDGHIGSSKMKALIQSCAYWPGFSKDIEHHVQRCQSCTVYQKTVDKPPLTEIANQATEPYEIISVDLTGPSESTQGKTLLTIVDHYSRYPEVYILHRASSREIMDVLRTTISRFGIPQKLLSDNGTPFVSSEFETFLLTLGIKHIYSANYHPIANGCVERFHCTLKSRMNRITYEQNVSLQAAVDKALFDIRSTPNSMTGETPFFRFFSRTMRTTLSQLTNSRVSSASRDASKEYRNKYKGRVIQYRPNDLIFYRKGAKELFSGRGKIIRSAGKNAYEILTENNLTRVYNQCDLKRRFDEGNVDYNFANDLYDHAVSSAVPKQPVFFDTAPPKKYYLRNRKVNPQAYKD